MEICWLVEEKVMVYSDNKKLRMSVKKNILKLLEGTDWELDENKKISFKENTAYYVNDNGNKEEMDVICGPTGDFALYDKNHILIINYLPEYKSTDEDFVKKSQQIIGTESLDGNTFNKKIEKIYELLEGCETSNKYEILEFIYLSGKAKKVLFEELGNSARGSMEAQFIKPLRDLRNQNNNSNNSKKQEYICEAVDDKKIYLQYGLGDK